MCWFALIASAYAQPSAAPDDSERVVLDATPPDALGLALDAPTPRRARVTATRLRAGQGVQAANARHLRDEEPALQAQPKLDVSAFAQHTHDAGALPVPRLSQPNVPNLTARLLRRSEVHHDPVLGPIAELQEQWGEVRSALAISPLYGTTTARLPTSTTDEGVLISSEAVWYNLVNARSRRRLDVEHGELMPLHFGPYVGNWRTMMQRLRGTNALQADYGVRLGLSW